jgi:hypothetical protein
VKDEHVEVSDFFSRSSVLHTLPRTGTVSVDKSVHRVRVLSVCDGHVGLVQRMGLDGFLQTFLISKVVTTWSRWIDMTSRLRRYGGHGSRVGSTGG